VDVGDRTVAARRPIAGRTERIPGGPHHLALLPIVNRLGEQGSEIHVISVVPETGGTVEPVDETVSALSEIESLHIHNVTADSGAGCSPARPTERSISPVPQTFQC